jgi:hypothetical protein
VIKGSLELKTSDNLKYLEHQAKSVLLNPERFADDHILPVHVGKTKSMIIYNPISVPKPKIEYKSFTIECVKSFNFLGVEIGTKLGWENFINNP